MNCSDEKRIDGEDIRSWATDSLKTVAHSNICPRWATISALSVAHSRHLPRRATLSAQFVAGERVDDASILKEWGIRTGCGYFTRSFRPILRMVEEVIPLSWQSLATVV